MISRDKFLRKFIALTLAGVLSCGLLSGCQFSSIDEYLESLGMKDASDNTNEASSEGTYYVSEDVAVNSSATISSSAEADEGVSFTSEGEANSKPEKSTKTESSSKNVSGTVSEKEMKAAREAIGLTDSNLEAIKKKQEGLYAFERLTNEGKTLYAEILTILENQASDILVSTTSDEAVELIFDYVLIDHPEIFYVDGYQYTNHTRGDVIEMITFTGNYTYTPEQVADKKAKINEAVNKCLANAPSSEDEYYAIKYIYEYLITNTDYDLEAEDNQNICSVFINGKSVCNGYAKAAQYLLNKIGVKCTLVTGTVDTKSSKGVRHAWNLVQCNGTYYYVDVTWGDSSYQTSNGETADATKLPAVNYDYLCVTSDDIGKTHHISDIIDMPVCSSMTDNYYVREDEYFKSAEMSLIKDLFDRRYKDGSDNVTMKCATKEVYDSIFEQLITNKGVFDVLQGDTSSVSYTTFAETRTIIFWIDAN